MAGSDRSLRRSSDQVDVFDAAEDEVDSDGSRLPILIVIALVVLACFAGVVWLAYEKGVASGRGEPKLIAAEQGPVRETPASPGGVPSEYKGLKIYQQAAPSDAEIPTGNPPNVRRSVSTASTAVPPALRPHASDSAGETKPSQLVQLLVTPSATKTVEIAPRRKPQGPAETAAARPATSTAALPTVTAQTATTSLTTAPQPTTVSTSQSAGASKGEYVLQIGSYKSEDEANSAWLRAQASHPALAGLSADIKKVDLGGKGTWFRLRATPFADKAAAEAACSKIKSDGGNCILTR